MPASDRILIAAGGGALILLLAAGWLLLAPVGSPEPMASIAVDASADGEAQGDLAAHGEPTVGGEIVVDVEGAVVRPGVHRLPGGSRVADAIDAAGGYALSVDLDAASVALNLARELADGEQVHVPAQGEVAAAPGGGASSAGSTGGAGGGGGLVNINTATPAELEALPGIGPVTVQKIVAARQERPFTSLEDAVERGVMNRGQLEQIQALATAA